uniref:Nuclear pore complex protein Nup153 n=1 Tax=Stomoxys calcitrans TaxID=35570 RepID=A0A1I8NQ47_STOCA
MKMSEYGLDEDSSPSQQQIGGEAHNLSTDDPTNAANNSIIGKVKSRVSSILPNSLSKWFSPSSKVRSEELNGSLNCNATITRRKRRIDIDDDEDEEEENENYVERQARRGIHEENHNIRCKMEENSEAEEDEEDDDDDDSQNSEEEYNATVAAQKTRHDLFGRQPPAKRSRLQIDMRDSPLIAPRRPLIASTPAVASTYTRNSIGTTSASRSSYQRYTHLNLYGNQSKKEQAYNFNIQKDTAAPKMNTDIIDLISQPPNEIEERLAANSDICSRTARSSRKSLNIPTSANRSVADRLLAPATHLKRPSLSSATLDTMLPSNAVGTPPRRTSTTIHEVKESAEHSALGEADDENNELSHNGQLLNEEPNEPSCSKRAKRQNHINGSGFNNPRSIPEENDAILLDTASESSESGTTELNKSKHERKTGLFNTSIAGTGTTRNSSRTSSFGNGLNFYSHLEGKKSLFNSASGHGMSNQLNNSTLSLNSLNRRQFNASIYGSTSALSDSRLLNTFSPFYKGKTTYGGAAAYNKYTAGAGASAVRITPTLIRPASSLSTLSSSNNSLSTAGIGNPQQIGEISNISSTAKRILDLINDFATPLSEAKKMASTIKTNAYLPPQAKSRLNDSDLNASRAMRLSQVRTPYARPAVILQPSGNANIGSRGSTMLSGPTPPVRELQVPTMSQLLQMKKIQNMTERARKITRDSSATNAEVVEYTLPVTTKTAESAKVAAVEDSGGRSSGASEKQPQPQLQQKHTNKIKNKITTTMRASVASKDIHDEAPPPTLNLPNIAFPLMQSVPKFDIQFSTSPTLTSATSHANSVSTEGGKTTPKPLSSSISQIAFNTKPISTTSVDSVGKKETTTTKSYNFGSGVSTSSAPTTTLNFKFSEPLVVKGLNTPTQNITPSNLDNYKFSPPLEVTQSMTPTKTTPLLKPQQPQLKSGSCLDVLNKPLALPGNSNKTTTESSTSASLSSNSFGDKFKKASNEWECGTCMIRNKADLPKCVACETPRKSDPTPVSESNISTFGDKFKKSSSEWECDTCMIRNKQESIKCVACETPRKGLSSSTTKNIAVLPPIKNTFGDAFKPKSGSWECSTCLISNKSDSNECVACQTKKPGSSISSSGNTTTTATTAAPSVSTFKFGFSAAQTTNAPTTTDAGFKNIAAQQKASKWECDACMTRNDAERTKCACCEQPKPGSVATESSSSTTKFTFGATAAAKFSFGFGPGSNAPKEDELRKDKAVDSVAKNDMSITSKAANNNTTLPTSGFQFGFKPTPTLNTENKTDETDTKNTKSSVATSSSTVLKGFQFGSVTETTKKPEVPSTTATTFVSSGFNFGTKTSNAPTTTTTTATTSTSTSVKMSKPAVSSPSVKFNLPTTGTTFSFASNSSSATTGVVSFGTKPAVPAPTDEKKSEGFAFKTPAAVSSSTTSNTGASSGGFTFGSPAASSSTAITPAITSSTSTTPTTTALVKPMFSFGTSNTTPATSSVVATTTTSSGGFGSFSFGGNNTPSTAVKPLFGAVTSTTSTTTSASSNTSTKPAATTNVFGSFAGTTSATPTFGSSSAIANPANNSTAVSSSTNSSNMSANNATPTFGTFGVGSNSANNTTNVFGSFGSSSTQSNSTQNKPAAATAAAAAPPPVFGSVASSNTNTAHGASPSTNAFVFGSATNTAVTASGTSSFSSAAANTSFGSKNTFVFGSPAPLQSTTATTAQKDAPKPSLFGAFGSGGTGITSNQATTSIFGSPASFAPATAATSPPPVFGSNNSSSIVTTTNPSTNLFGMNSAPAPAPVTNIFGANPSGNAATPAPAFGSSPFGGGGSASSTSATPTFGSTAVTGSATFGGFGATVGNTTNPRAEVKKIEPAFNFGSAQTTQQSVSGGFNFGSTSAPTKPAFNFGSTGAAQPTFNFTGSSENSAKPFQFGAIPSAPVFNFGGGAIETTPNAPFQFNAGAAPVSDNIFAPAPTPGAQTAQQAKRKIRAPIRRVTQR